MVLDGSARGHAVAEPYPWGDQWDPRRANSFRGGSYLCHPSYCNRNQLSGRTDGEAPMGHIGFRVAT
jgi:hypothetical protein